MTDAPCLCGHSKAHHIDGNGLCLVKSCHYPVCLIYRPRPPTEPPAAGPQGVCWEYQDGELPIRLSFSIKVF